MGDYEYEEFEDNDEEVRELKLLRGIHCKKVLRFCVFKEMKEKEERMMKYKAHYAPKKKKYKAKKGKKVVVASEDESSVQRSCSPTSSEANWSSLTGSKVPVSLLGVHHPTKKRTAGTSYKAAQHDKDRTIKCQKTMKYTKWDDEEPSMAKELQGCSSSSEGRWSPDSPLVIQSWNHHNAIPTTKKTSASMKLKNRTTVVKDNIVQEHRTKKRKYMKIKTEEEHQQKEERKHKIMKKNSKQLPPPPPPQGGMPIDLQRAINELGGTNPEWLTEKRKLRTSDTNPKLGRLFIPPCGGVLENYLTAEEKDKLLNPTDDSNGLQVLVVDTSGEHFDVDLRIWSSLEKYVFARNWNKMVERLRMEPESDTIQLWCFRLPAERGSNLCFATNIERGCCNAEEDMLEAEPG